MCELFNAHTLFHYWSNVWWMYEIYRRSSACRFRSDRQSSVSRLLNDSSGFDAACAGPTKSYTDPRQLTRNRKPFIGSSQREDRPIYLDPRRRKNESNHAYSWDYDKERRDGEHLDCFAFHLFFYHSQWMHNLIFQNRICFFIRNIINM